VTTVASNDLQQVRDISRRMVAQWGFLADGQAGDREDILRAPIAWESANGREAQSWNSKSTEKLLDAEVAKLVDEAWTTCKATIGANKALMDELVVALLDKETVGSAEFEKMVAEKGVMLSR